MYYVLIKNVAREGRAEEYAEVSKRFGAEMERLPGCLRFEVIRSEQEPDVIANLICWESKEAAQADDGLIGPAVAVGLVSLLFLVRQSYNPFIYFRF